VPGRAIDLENDRLTERHIRNDALSPAFPDRKSVKAHAHHVVFAEPHGKSGKVARLPTWLRRNAARAMPAVRAGSRACAPLRPADRVDRAASAPG